MAYISFQPSDFFNTLLYDGNNSTQALTGVGFQPGFCWIKSRNNTDNHALYDAVRGATKTIYSNDQAAEVTNANGLTSFDADGFTCGDANIVNGGTGRIYFSLSWKAGTTTGIDTTGSTITPSAYSFNQTNGFSIVQYTGNDTAGAKVPHGLGVAPKMVIIKSTSSTNYWVVGHASAGWTHYAYLNTNGAVSADATRFNDTAPDSVNVTLGSGGNTNGSGGDSPFIMYSFAPIKGFSAISQYRGNGNTDGPFVETGFRPAFVMIKYDAAGNWYMFNNKALGYNPDNEMQYADLGNAEGTTDAIDFLSNGFKLRHTDTGYNANNETYYYIAFADFPFVSSNSKACVAR
jgi:hypothetical protein